MACLFLFPESPCCCTTAAVPPPKLWGYCCSACSQPTGACLAGEAARAQGALEDCGEGAGLRWRAGLAWGKGWPDLPSGDRKGGGEWVFGDAHR